MCSSTRDSRPKWSSKWQPTCQDHQNGHRPRASSKSFLRAFQCDIRHNALLHPTHTPSLTHHISSAFCNRIFRLTDFLEECIHRVGKVIMVGHVTQDTRSRDIIQMGEASNSLAPVEMQFLMMKRLSPQKPHQMPNW